LDDEALFLASLPVIDGTAGQICRRHHMTGADAEDFRSVARLHFMERNCEVLRRFEGRSSLPTYVNVVIQRLFLDYRNRQWGRWRPSAEAKRYGPTAILLEQLIVRDGWTAEQAAEILRVNHGITIDEPLTTLCNKFSDRTAGREFVSEAGAETVESPGPGADVDVIRGEQDFLAQRVRRALNRARQALDPQERLVLKMRFEDSVSIADISRALHLDQKRLYRMIERLLARIGRCIEAEGISRSEVRTLFADGTLDWSQSAEPGEGGRTLRSERARASWLQQ
jgi:RNA polymerase sigma factor (sigma-70 family)